MKLIIARYGESDFDDWSTREGWLTEHGVAQMERLAEKLSCEVNSSSIVVTSASRRGRAVRNIFKRVSAFQETVFVLDLACKLDDSHAIGTADELVRAIVDPGLVETLILVGHYQFALQLAKRLTQTLKYTLPKITLTLDVGGDALVLDLTTQRVRRL